MNFGTRLGELLKENNISQATLAEKVGVSQRAVSKWVNLQAEPTESSIVKCAKFFSVTTDYILGVSNDY